MRDTLIVEPSPKVAKKRKQRIVIWAGLALVALWIIYVSTNVLFPSQGEVHGRSDAVVSLAPQYHRLHTATQLMNTGHAETLAVSHFHDDVGISESDPTNQVSVTDYCETHNGDGVICFTPEEIATIGEAFEIRDIASRESWETLTVVTSRTHAFRAHHIFDHCVGENVRVNLVHSDPEFNCFQWAWHLAYENAAFIKALWQTGTRC